VTGVLDGRAAIVTGGSQGLGLEIARTYLAAGARVLVCARDATALERARIELESAAHGMSIETVAADVSEPAEVRALVAHALDRFSRVDVLVNNAGVYGPKGPIEDVDWDDWEHAIRVNLLGSVLCCRAVLPHFRGNGYGKIIQLSGGGATSPLPRLSAYAASKAAVVRFAETLAEEVRGTGIDVNAIAPGALNTRLLDEVLEAGPERVGDAFYKRALEQRSAGGTPLDLPARLALFLASAESDGITGKLISAAWDPWEEFPSHAEDLRGTDVYTLRRIVPPERGLSWGWPIGKRSRARE
jgi:NAD(P)-dependent dehydrogenase (short-subunit alcohol dehydrogenase family)